ncbi:MAG: lectin-like protein [Lentisphaeria bacterium]
MWLGLTDEDVEGEFIWIDGTPLAGNYSNWSTRAVGGQTDEPNNGFWDGAAHAAENYAFLVGAGKTNPRLVRGLLE